MIHTMAVCSIKNTVLYSITKEKASKMFHSNPKSLKKYMIGHTIKDTQPKQKLTKSCKQSNFF